MSGGGCGISASGAWGVGRPGTSSPRLIAVEASCKGCHPGGGRGLRQSGAEVLGFGIESDRTVQIPDFGLEQGSREPG